MPETGERGAFFECAVNEDWRAAGMAVVVAARHRSESELDVVYFLIDLRGLGVKGVSVLPSVEVEAYRDRRAKVSGSLEPCDPGLARAIVDAGHGWGDSLGIAPPEGFAAGAELLSDIEPAEVEIACGVEGRPQYHVDVADDVVGNVERLRDGVGDDGFDVVVPGGDPRRQEVQVFLAFIEDVLPADIEAGQLGSILAIAGQAWNLALLDEGAEAAAELLISRLDALGIPAEQTGRLFEQLIARKREHFAEADFTISPEITTLAELGFRGRLTWAED